MFGHMVGFLIIPTQPNNLLLMEDVKSDVPVDFTLERYSKVLLTLRKCKGRETFWNSKIKIA